MRRREFIASMGGAAVLPFAAKAQKRLPRIGYLSPEPADAGAAFFEAFRAGLRDFGYAEGKSIELVARFPERGDDRLPELVGELIDLKVDVIVTGAIGVYIAHRATQSIPIVAIGAGDLVGLGLAESLSHPGGNITGLTMFVQDLVVKRVEMLKRVKPSISNMGLLLRRGADSVPSYVRALQGPAKAMGLDMQWIEVSDIGECEAALSAGPGAAIDGLVVTDFPMFTTGAGPATVAGLAAHRGLASAGGLPFARKGGLMAYSVEIAQLCRRGGFFVDRILKGAKPGDIPIEQATRFTTIVNLKTSRALGVAIPADMLAAADEVIE